MPAPPVRAQEDKTCTENGPTCAPPVRAQEGKTCTENGEQQHNLNMTSQKHDVASLPVANAPNHGTLNQSSCCHDHDRYTQDHRSVGR